MGYRLLASVLAAVPIGCATPGPPRPPSLNLPERPTGLTAERIAGRVELRWSSTANSSDGQRLRGAITAVVCRGVPPAAHAAPVCNPIERFAVLPGPDHAVEVLAPALAQGDPRPIFYQVELLNAAGRSLGASAPVYAAAGQAPPAAGLLLLRPVKAGVEARWSTPADSAAMRLERTALAALPGTAAARAATQRSSAPQPGQRKPAPKPSAPEPVILEDSRTTGIAVLPGGLIDPTVLDGGRYRYIAQRVRRVSLAGQSLELRGEPSPAAEVLYRQVFPPLAPTGLVAVPGGGFGVPASIDLSWDPSPEASVAGYRVYRAGPDGGFTRLNASAIDGPAYRDLTVLAGQTWRYRITAVDRLGNESPPSAIIEATAPQDDKRR